MRRTVSCRLQGDAHAAGEIVFAVAVARGHAPVEETLTITLDGEPLDAHELDDEHGSRLHRVSVPRAGALDLAYRATVGTAPAPAVAAIDAIRYARPSRYCESDRLGAFAQAEFGSLAGAELLAAVRNWVNRRLVYVGGSSRGTDGATQTLLAGEGVCRDFAHLVVALLRACEMPARMAAVYAPGLAPMDFHAVAEAALEGVWFVIDATGLAPRASMVRIATGRDAADTAFMTTRGGRIALEDVEVRAIVDGALPYDDPAALVRLT